MSKSKSMPFTQIPLEVLCNSKLSTSARVLYGLILSKVSKEGYCYATNETLAEWLGTEERTVVRKLKELKNADLVRTYYTEKSRKIYPQKVVNSPEKGLDKNVQKGASTMSTYNSLSKERQEKVLWQRPSPFLKLDPVGSSPNEEASSNEITPNE